MSYDIALVCPVTGKTLKVDFKHQIAGGTYAFGGSHDLSLNITSNYSSIFERVFSHTVGIRILSSLSGAESIPLITQAISRLKDDVSDDYWKATEGNVKKSLHGLLALAQMRPDGVWSICY